MRRPLVIANWKMNTTLSDAIVLTNAVKRAVEDLDTEIVLCPPFVWLVPMAEILERKSGNLSLGAQNMWFAEKGPMTGEISPLMLKNLVKYVILGHSERRNHFSESNALVNDKIEAALNHKITPIVCVGEYKKMYESKRTAGRPTAISLRSDLIHQLDGSLKGINRDRVEDIAIAYEPVWAISSGTASSRNAAEGSYANDVCGKLREFLAKKYNKGVSERIRILYGGSVASDNIREFMYQPEIDGVLVGGASLKAKEFIEICKEAGGRE